MRSDNGASGAGINQRSATMVVLLIRLRYYKSDYIPRNGYRRSEATNEGWTSNLAVLGSNQHEPKRNQLDPRCHLGLAILANELDMGGSFALMN